MSVVGEDALIAAIMDARSQIDFLWQFFVTVHIAIFALLLVYDHAVEGLNWVARIFAVFAVGAFEWINGNALSGAYTLLDSMLEQYRWSFGQAERFQPAFYKNFVLASYADRPEMVMLTHASALLFVILAFTSRKFIQTARTGAEARRHGGMPPLSRD